MAEDYYPPMEEGGSKDESATALIPKSLLAGKDFQPGDEVVLKVVHIFEDEVEVEYAKEPEGGGESDKGMESAENELRGMDALKEES